MRAAEALDARQRLGLDRAELGEVLGRDLGDAHAAAGRAAAAAGAAAGPRRKRLDVVLGDPALLAGALDLGEVDLELAGEAAHAGAGMDQAGIGGSGRSRGLRRRGGGRLGCGRRLLLGDHRGRRRHRRVAGGGLAA